LNGLAQAIGCDNEAKELERVIDKIDSLGLEGVINELTTPRDGPFDSKLVFGSIEASVLRDFLNISGVSASETLTQVAAFFKDHRTEADAGIAALKTMVDSLRNLGIPEDFWKIDLSVARGLDYYTGPVFETVVPDMKDIGSIFSGGRFDGLVSRFISNSNMPGVGASIGLDRTLTVLRRLGLAKDQVSLTEVLVGVWSSELAAESQKTASVLRHHHIKTELYLGEDKGFKNQLAYAVKQGIRFMVIIGPDEAAKNLISLKDLTTKKQVTLTIPEATARILDSVRGNIPFVR
jgi:histidyl-tRNA synthetase